MYRISKTDKQNIADISRVVYRLICKSANEDGITEEEYLILKSNAKYIHTQIECGKWKDLKREHAV